MNIQEKQLQIISKEFYDGEIQKLYAAAGWSDADQKYTGETQPVKWIRIHNLPDFAYFNHSQHVSCWRCRMSNLSWSCRRNGNCVSTCTINNGLVY